MKRGMGRVFLLLLLITTSVYGFGQNVDSLFTLYSQSKGAQRIKVANEIAQATYELECTDTLYVLSGKESPQHTDAIVYELLSSYETYALDDYRRGIASALKSAGFYMQIGDTVSSDIMYYNTANFYSRTGDYEHAIELLLRCYEIEKQMNNTVALSHTLNSMGVIYSQWGQSEIAIKYFLESLEYERPLNRPMQYATRLSSLAKEYLLLGQNREALTLIQEALAYDEKIARNEREERVAVHLNVLGDIYAAMDSLAQAEDCFRSSIEVFERNNRQQPHAEALLSLGRLHLRQHRLPEAIETLKSCAGINLRAAKSLKKSMPDFCYYMNVEVLLYRF